MGGHYNYRTTVISIDCMHVLFRDSDFENKFLILRLFKLIIQVSKHVSANAIISLLMNCSGNLILVSESCRMN